MLSVQSACYSLSPTINIYHLLSSASLETTSIRVLNLLLQRDMPYQRCTKNKTFHACFRAPDVASHHTPILYTCHANSTAAPIAVSEAVEVLDHYAARFVNDAVGGFNEMSIILSNGELTDLLARAEDEERVAAHRGVYQ